MSVRAAALSLTLCAFLGCADDASPPPEPGTSSSDPEVAEAYRIASLVPSLAEIIVALGGRDRLAVRTDYDTHPVVLELPSIGGGLDPSVEDLVAHGVDAVLMPEGQGMPALAEQLASVGIRALPFATETIADLHGTIGRLGMLVGRSEAADSLSRDIDQGLARVAERVAGLEPVPVMYVIWPDPPQTVAAGTYIDELIELAGGVNVFSDAPTAWPTVGFESIVARAPEAVIWPRSEASPRTSESIRDMPGWRDVRAVKEGNIIFVDGVRFNRPGPDIAELALGLAAELHPEAVGPGPR